MEIPKEFLSKEFLSQFKSQEDVEAFLTELHVKVYESMLLGEMDAPWVMRNSQRMVLIAAIRVMGSIISVFRERMERPNSKFLVMVRASLSL